MAPAARPPNGFLASLSEDDFELVRPHLKTVDLAQDLVLVEVDEMLKRAYLPHRGVISLVVRLARGEHVHIAMVGRDSIFGSFAALGDATALNGAVVLVPGVASTLDIDRLRAAADNSATLRAELMRHGLAVCAQVQQTAVEVAAPAQAIRELVEQTHPTYRVARLELAQCRPVVLQSLASVVRSLAKVAEFLLARKWRG